MPRMDSINTPIIDEDDLKAVSEVLRSGKLTNPRFEGGEWVRRFEEEFSSFIGVKHSVAVINGTAALHVALRALGVGEGDEVIVPSFTFYSTATSVLLAGGRPVFADINPETMNIGLDEVKPLVTDKTKAIIVVHLYGLPADLDPIVEFAHSRGIFVVEDAAQAVGAEYRGRRVGSIGDVGCFSFYATKNMTTGEGGMITTNDDGIADRLRMIRSHGFDRSGEPVTLGYNYRMPEYSAALGVSQLRKLGRFLEARRRNARLLSEVLGRAGDSIKLPWEDGEFRHAWNLYTVRLRGRDELKDYLNRRGVGAAVYYEKPVYKAKIFQNLGYRARAPNAEEAASTVLSLPIHPLLSEGEEIYIGETVLKWLEGRGV